MTHLRLIDFGDSRHTWVSTLQILMLTGFSPRGNIFVARRR